MDTISIGSESDSDSEDLEHFDQLSDGEIENESKNTILQSFEISEIYQCMQNDIDEVKDIVKLSNQNTKSLLSYFKYDKHLLLEHFYEYGMAKLFKDASINLDSESRYTKTIEDKNNNSMCEICFEGTDCLNANCGHNNFCRDCWKMYIKSQVMSEGNGNGIFCPALKCDFQLDDSMVLNLLSDPDVKAKYQYLVSNQFVVCNRQLKFCPEANCHIVIKSDLIQSSVQCKCGHFFCFQCGETMHLPVKCETLKRWETLMASDYGSKKWIYENTKPCPSCSTPIQKNGGCNHLNCAKCGTDFCWVSNL